MMRRALVIAPNWIGDALMAQPLFILLKKQYPRLVIDVVAPPWVAPVIECMPEINHVHAAQLRHGRVQLWQRWRLASTLRKRYDAAYILPNSFKSALLPWFSSIRQRIGYQGEHRYGLLNVRHANPSKRCRPPMRRHYAALAFAPSASLPDDLPVPRLKISQNEAAQVLKRFQIEVHVPRVVFCPGAEFGEAKRWPAGHFARLAQLIISAFPETHIVLLGTAKDQSIGDHMTVQRSKVHNLCGKTALNDACALISQASVVVSNDSGLMHVAAALDRPLIALYGSSDPRHTPPLSDRAQIQWLHLACSPCFARTCPLGHLNCLQTLHPEQVFEPLREILCREKSQTNDYLKI
jgi:heptosyltransferase II